MSNIFEINGIKFSETSDVTILAVEGKSSDFDLIQAIGKAEDSLPKKVKYFEFLGNDVNGDRVLAVIKAKGKEEYTTRAMRSPNRASERPLAIVDPVAAWNAERAQLANRKKALRDQLLAHVARLRTEKLDAIAEYDQKIAEAEAKLVEFDKATTATDEHAQAAE